ncbi:ead/Ea22-like family protein [Pseudomonas kurunegalensis]|uniref:ead/Ea22-like family protein n=1 Tax=Pseudomonas kurunegalensis TaxID=485880 RepID=UPI00257087BE|nr:ead/Ea22-like family protein [Pseudomonas kurunegalensis]WJD60606.1 ead/Ea22-like family protein [Pseudomonas kurunegalensis]
MDTNKMRELKALAEAATQGEWSHERFGVIQAGPVIQFANGAGRQQIAMATGADWMVQGEQIANAEFMAAANPSVVLALIAEIERLATSRSKKERELEQELEVWHHGPFCWTCGDTGDVHDITGEWRAECDCLSAQLINANRERDQLKAENEDYKSGQERYEQIIEDLKAEIEALRKDAERYRWLRKPWQEQRQVKAWTSLEVMDENIDAAMAKEASHD